MSRILHWESFIKNTRIHRDSFMAFLHQWSGWLILHRDSWSSVGEKWQLLGWSESFLRDWMKLDKHKKYAWIRRHWACYTCQDQINIYFEKLTRFIVYMMNWNSPDFVSTRKNFPPFPDNFLFSGIPWKEEVKSWFSQKTPSPNKEVLDLTKFYQIIQYE